MNILIGTDVEGVAGVSMFEQETRGTAPYYERTKRLLTEEINAAIEGMIEEGAEDLLVVDGHGPGGVSYELLHERAKLMHGRPNAPRSERGPIINRYDVCVMIGQHAMAGVKDGTMNHTQSSKNVESYTLNGKPIGEIAQFALFHGAYGLPLIFLSGDVAACREAEELIPGITTTAVKEGLSRQSAISVAKEQSHRMIREGIKEAIRRHREKPVQPLAWDPPFVLEKRFLFTELADAYDMNPLYERIDAKTVRVTGDEITKVIYA